MENKETKQPYIISQLEEALEERQNGDRRKNNVPLEEGVDDRRKLDRRAATSASE